MMLAIKEAASDMSPYVRKTAAHAIPKLYRWPTWTFLAHRPEKQDSYDSLFTEFTHRGEFRGWCLFIPLRLFHLSTQWRCLLIKQWLKESLIMNLCFRNLFLRIHYSLCSLLESPDPLFEPPRSNVMTYCHCVIKALYGSKRYSSQKSITALVVKSICFIHLGIIFKHNWFLTLSATFPLSCI